MTTSRQTNRPYIVALFVFGFSSIFGLGFLMYRLLPEIKVHEPSALVLLPAVVVAVIAALFIFGVFLGYFYRNPTARWLISKKTRANFRNALSFERKERIRLERELYDTRQSVVGLKDRLAKAHFDSDDEAVGRADDELLKKIEKEKEQLEKKHDRLQSDLIARKERIADLLTEIAIAQTEVEEARAEIERLKNEQPEVTERNELKIATEDASIKDVLDNITKLDGIEMALIADDFGLVVETSEAVHDAENLAAASSLASRISSRLKEIMTMGAVSKVVIGDEEGFVLENTYFELFNLRCSLTIVRDKDHEYPGLAEKSIEAIASRLAE
jgi:predicted regulator of Ras-like GTPase activity (Roadblock/LC7/MglB family)